jgi:hypothetical protein
MWRKKAKGKIVNAEEIFNESISKLCLLAKAGF